MAESALLAQLRNASDFLEVELTDVLRDKGALNVLVSHFTDYASLFRKGAAFVRSLPRDREPCILLDCDVIYSYLHPEKMKPDQTLLASWLFERSKLKYAIPSGAYKELLAHLSDCFGLPPQPIPRREYSDPRSAVMGRLGISNDLSQDPTVISFVENTTDERVMRLDRLLKILENKDRFCGIICSFDNDIKEMASQLVSSEREDAFERLHHFSARSRQKLLPHDKNDSRDGENLAIALSSSRGAESKFHFLLVTMTRPVLGAARHLYKRNASATGAWFALSPMDLLVPARLGFGDSDGRLNVRNQLSNLNDEVSALIDKYNAVLDKMNAGIAPSEYQIGVLVNESRETLNELVRHDIKRIESIYEPIVSARLAAVDLVEFHGEGRIAEFHPRFSSYLRLLERVRATIHQLSGVEYAVREMPSPCPDELKQFKIGSCADGEAFEEFIRLDVFERGGQLDLWCAQWDLDVNERSLFEAIDELYRGSCSDTDRMRGASGAIVTVDPPSDSPLWESGIVLSNGYSSFGIHLGDALATGRWSDVSLARLKRLVVEDTIHQETELRTFLDIEDPAHCAMDRGTMVRDRPRAIPVFSAQENVVEVRVNLPEVDLVFELVPPEGRFRQRFTMISSRPLYGAIAHFYDWLGVRLAVKRGLENSIKNVLGPYFN